MAKKPRILLIEDNRSFATDLADVLEPEFAVSLVHDVVSAVEHLAHEVVDLVLLDLELPLREGETTPLMEGGYKILAMVRDKYPSLEVIVVTGVGTGAPEAVRAMKQGAYDYFIKSFKQSALDELVETCKKALRTVALSRENTRFGLQLSREAEHPRELFRISGDPRACRGIVGSSAAVSALLDRIDTVSSLAGGELVLVTGESGTGKELVAKALHYNSDRASRPPIIVNVAALSDGLIDSELFGHTKGAFTGAVADRAGFFEAADGSTLVLDEIGDLSESGQTRLLRVLEDGRVRRVGSNEGRDVDTRVIALTNKPLPAMVQEGSFRRDLLARLNRIAIELVPLRERLDDVPLLVQTFLESAAEKSRRPIVECESGVVELLQEYGWTGGNVRELKNFIEPMAMLSPDGVLSLESVEAELDRHRALASEMGDPVRGAAAPIERTPLPSSDDAMAAIQEWDQGQTVPRPVAEALVRLFIDHHGNATNLANAIDVARARIRGLLDRHVIPHLATELLHCRGDAQALARDWHLDVGDLRAAARWNQRVFQYLNGLAIQAGSRVEAAKRLGLTSAEFSEALDRVRRL